MKRKFICRDCKTIFESDDQNEVLCPTCHRDNVEPYSPRRRGWLWLALTALIVIIAVIVSYVMLGKKPEPEPEPKPSPNPDSVVVVTDYAEQIPPTVEVSEPDFDGENYSVVVTAKNVPQGVKVTYVCQDHFGNHEILKTSDNGNFCDIPPCDDDGHTYDFAIKDSKADTFLCAPVPKPGFIRVVLPTSRMTPEQLQQLIDTDDSSLYGAGQNNYLSTRLKLKFNELPADARNIPENLPSVLEKIAMGTWASVKVKSLEYDNNNRISLIIMDVVVD